jgi:uncharacterized radical SAM protein YgiQ
MSFKFLPMTLSEVKQKGWDELDIILVSGDKYVDHHSNGTAVVGRFLEKHGFRVGIIAEPDWNSNFDFTKLGKPRLFFGISSGAIDSMLCNYTANKKPRNDIESKKPDRALIVYTNKIKENFKDIPIVLGGLEASMRRLAHYDYWDNKVRRSILLDAKADILVYGMGERQILEIANRLNAGENISQIDNIRGTVILKNNLTRSLSGAEGDKNSEITNDGFGYAQPPEMLNIPSFEDVTSDKKSFNLAFKIIYENQIPASAKILVQKHGNRFIIHNPPQFPYETKELDSVFELPYENTWHPAYDDIGGVASFETVKFSVISNIGCTGECYFCSIFIHQGKIVQSRSAESIIKEVEKLAKSPDFHGTISDVGGPTANLLFAKCKRWENGDFCNTKSCMLPKKCENLKLAYNDCIKLYEKIQKIDKVKHVFIQSGLRYDLLVDTENCEKYLEYICKHNVSGRLKIAPEHIEDKVLQLMNKPSLKVYKKFLELFEKVTQKIGKNLKIVNYFITSYPGTSLNKALDFGLYCVDNKIHPEQMQDFIPLPMTASSCMYHTEENPFTGEKVFIPKTLDERNMQRALVQYKNKNSKLFIRMALRKLNKQNLYKRFF